jgi:hypothetical protein
MNLAELQKKLIAAARNNPPSEHVPYAFEKRIMARLKDVPMLDHWALWSRALWKGVAPCVAIMLLLSAWSFFTSTTNAPGSDLSQEFEKTVLAAADQDSATDLIW